MTNIDLLTKSELLNLISKIEVELFQLRFKKATRQKFNSHQIKLKKKQIAKLKTLLAEKI